jgi:hypothetical protein
MYYNDKNRTCVYLHVREDKRKQGYGSILVQFLIEFVQTRTPGSGSVRIETGAVTAASEGLFKKADSHLFLQIYVASIMHTAYRGQRVRQLRRRPKSRRQKKTLKHISAVQ